MRKWIIPTHTPEQLRIEVCSFGLDHGPARLNVQHVRVLEPRLASPEVLVELQREALEEAREEFDECSPEYLQELAGRRHFDRFAKAMQELATNHDAKYTSDDYDCHDYPVSEQVERLSG